MNAKSQAGFLLIVAGAALAYVYFKKPTTQAATTAAGGSTAAPVTTGCPLGLLANGQALASAAPLFAAGPCNCVCQTQKNLLAENCYSNVQPIFTESEC